MKLWLIVGFMVSTLLLAFGYKILFDHESETVVVSPASEVEEAIPVTPSSTIPENLIGDGLASLDLASLQDVVAISVDFPADLLIIDSRGRRLGFDPQAQAVKQDIPFGTYSGRDLIQLIILVGVSSGEYQVLASGNGTGEIQVGISAEREGCKYKITNDYLRQIDVGAIETFVLKIREGCTPDFAELSPLNQ